MSALVLRLLGPPAIQLDGQPVHIGRHKAVALLAYLALDRQPHGRDALATLFWPDLDQSRARAELRRTLSLLNRTLGRTWLAVDRETAGWNPDAAVVIDVDRLRQRLAACESHGHAAEEACAECVPLLAEATDLYRDGFLAGFTLPDAPAFDEWQFFEAESLRDAAAGALQRLARWHERQGEYDAAIPHARRWLALDPLHEPAHRALMVLYARSGQHAAALRQYAECERLLAEELGIAPAAETAHLYQAIRERRELPQETTANAADDGSRMTDDASRLTDLRHNLPAQLTPLVGRGRDLAGLDALLADPDVRLLTVLAPGGMGKTRLALEAASRQLHRYPDGVWFVNLAPLHSLDHIAPAIAQAIGFSFYGPTPPQQQLATYLSRRQMLLLLDNFEHLLSPPCIPPSGGEEKGGTEEGISLLLELLRAAPRLDFLVTSRARLNLSVEHIFTLGAMDYPDALADRSAPADLRRLDAIVLFLRSARRARSDFELDEETLPHVARICQLVQGIPLAILLAAAWVPVLTPAEIAGELERGLDILSAAWCDEPQRHHSMRAVCDATWVMLTEKEQAILARLSVFRGGFTREAAQAVAGADLRALIALVNKSLIARDRSGRYSIHELLRQFGQEKLEQAEGERARTLDRHAAYYADWLHRKEIDLYRKRQKQALLETDNIRSAWHRLLSSGTVAQILQSLHGLFYFHFLEGPFQEAEATFAQAVAALRAQTLDAALDATKVALGVALAWQAYFLSHLGQVDLARPLVRESQRILRQADARRELAWSNLVMAFTSYPGADNDWHYQLTRESLALARETQYYPALAEALVYQGMQAAIRGAYSECEAITAELLELSRRAGDPGSMAMAQIVFGHLALLRQDYPEARRRYKQSLALLETVGSRFAIARVNDHLGDVALLTGDYEDARAYYQLALSAYLDLGVYLKVETPRIGGCYGVPVSWQKLGHIALAQGEGSEAKRCYRQALLAAEGRPEQPLKLHVLLGPVRWLASEVRLALAVELGTLVLQHPQSIVETRDAMETLLENLRSQFVPDAYVAAQARARARDLDATISELLVELESSP